MIKLKLTKEDHDFLASCNILWLEEWEMPAYMQRLDWLAEYGD